MRNTVLVYLTIVITALACNTAEEKKQETASRRNILWFDAEANFKRFVYKDSITWYLVKSKSAGVTDVVVDVKPITGEVLFTSEFAPAFREWEGVEKKDTFDYLAHFIAEGHRLGLTVHASTNVFVAGHNFFDRGVVYSDSAKAGWQTLSYLPQGMVQITQQKKKYSAMLNPARKDVQRYEMNILKELVRKYPALDGIILDRVRYDNLEADFSNDSRLLFENYIGKKVDSFPQAIFSYTADTVSAKKKGPYFNQWIEWRAKVIHDFIFEVRDELKAINPKLIFGDYTGSWYPTYFEVGVNWASKEYDPATQYPWATPEYKKYGYAEALDLYTTGSYYVEVEKSEAMQVDSAKVNRGEAAQSNARNPIYTVEGSAELAKELVKGKVPVYAGLYVEQYKEDIDRFVRALKMCRHKSDGAMVFDIVHIINKNWWDALKEGLTGEIKFK